MQKKFFSMITLLTFVLSCFTPFKGFAATEATLAEFSYTASAGTKEGDALSDWGGKDEGYSATKGIMKASAKFFASVDGTDYRKLEWSDDTYYDSENTGMRAPIMKPNKSTLSWGKSPYFEIVCSTKDYENIKFSAKVSGSKKGPAAYALQYKTSSDGTYEEITRRTISKGKDMSANLFNSISIPSGADNQTAVYFRIIAVAETNIDGSDNFPGTTGGEAAINNIIISGVSKSTAAPTLSTPAASVASGSEIYGNTAISLSCSTSSDAKIYYTINDGAETKYTGKFMPFKNVLGDTVTVKAWATQTGYNGSAVEVYTYKSTKDEITAFDFSDGKYPDYTNGAVEADSGVYPTGRITASLDSETQYSPLYSVDKKAISISPDDTYTWHKGGYWQIEASTAGYENVYLSADAFSSQNGPASMTLQYSTDGNSYKTLQSNVTLPVSDTGKYYSEYKLPDDAADKQKIYIRFVIQENKTAVDVNGTAAGGLFENKSKGNTYINKIVITGDRTSSLKMPYTTKATTYFGKNGTLSYKSFDDTSVKYSIYTKNGTPIAENMEYNSKDKISLAALAAFDAQLCNQFRVDVWAENGTQKSMINSQIYTYKGDKIAAFEYDETNGSAIANQNAVNATYGEAKLSMYPNGADAAEITYNTNALRAAASKDNTWKFDTDRIDADTDGYWLITASTKGYKDIKFSADQRSTSKGPRDYAISVSTDGENYTPLANSSIHVTDILNSTYSNISLPQELDNNDIIYIKIKIDGGEMLSEKELNRPADDPDFGKGNTEINNIELCGTKIENKLGIEGNPQVIEKDKAYYISYASETENPTVIFAGYNSSGALVMCNLHADKFEIPSGSDVTKIKIMLWKNIRSLVPIVSDLTKEVK